MITALKTPLHMLMIRKILRNAYIINKSYIIHRTLTHRRPIGGLPFGQRLRAVHTHLPPANACALIGAVVCVVHRQTHFPMRLPWSYVRHDM